jgi:hypothetical protein
VRGFRWGLSAVAVVVGVAAVILQNWWTATGMACVLIGQGLTYRDARRKAASEEVPPLSG